MHTEVRALFGRFVWRGINIYDITIHPSQGSRINPTLKVCETQLGRTRFSCQTSLKKKTNQVKKSQIVK